MAERKWFFLKNKGAEVSGPYASAEIEALIKESSAAECLIWGQGQAEWLTPALWTKFVKTHPEQAHLEKQRLWKLRNGDKEIGSFTYEDLLDQLRNIQDLTPVALWTDGYSEWREVYQIHKILDELGISRRENTRVPIMGQLECDGPKGHFQARALTISEGGLGATDFPELNLGERVRLVLKSPNLYTPIHATGEIVYRGADGYVGMKFLNLSTEYHNSIIEYVKKFSAT